MDAARAAFGLPRARDALFLPITSGNPYLVGASPRVVDAPPDWPPNVQLTGFFAWDTPRSYGPPRGLQEFLDAGPPPILITLGGSSAVDPQEFYPNAVRATRRLGHRALVLSGPTSEPSASTPLRTHSWLLASGLPQLIVPRGFDQPQTAVRMRRLGVATIMPWGRASAPALQSALAELLSTDGYRGRASTIASRLGQEQGLDNAADAIEQTLA